VIVLDTNVLVYALGEAHPLREPCRRIVQSVGRDIEAATTIEVIQEFLHVFGRRRPRVDVGKAGRAFVELLAPLIEADARDLELGIDLLERHAGLSAFDALVAAVALNHDAEALVTADRSFVAVPGLRVADPRSPEIDTLLAR
jgi:predicted nucleic acid-binding protein